jgi:hypothetical protein
MVYRLLVRNPIYLSRTAISPHKHAETWALGEPFMIKTRTEREGKLRGRQSFILLLALQGLASLTCDDILYPSHSIVVFIASGPVKAIIIYCLFYFRHFVLFFASWSIFIFIVAFLMASVTFYVIFISGFLNSLLLALLFFSSIIGFLLASYLVKVHRLGPII